MDLSARDINEKQFHEAWRGYNQEEVDEFLDRVAETLDRVQREHVALSLRVRELDQAVATTKDTEDMLKKTLVTAQQAAEEAIASAKAKAADLIAEAEETASRARRDTAELLAGTEADARRKMLEADRDYTLRRRDLDQRIERLTGLKQRLTSTMRSFIDEQLRSLDALAGQDHPHGRHHESPVQTPLSATSRPRAVEPESVAADELDEARDAVRGIDAEPGASAATDRREEAAPALEDEADHIPRAAQEPGARGEAGPALEDEADDISQAAEEPAARGEAGRVQDVDAAPEPVRVPDDEGTPEPALGADAESTAEWVPAAADETGAEPALAADESTSGLLGAEEEAPAGETSSEEAAGRTRHRARRRPRRLFRRYDEDEALHSMARAEHDEEGDEASAASPESEIAEGEDVDQAGEVVRLEEDEVEATAAHRHGRGRFWREGR